MNLEKVTTASRPASKASRLRLLQLASQALPTGAFAYSAGLESIHELGHLSDENSCIDYLVGLMHSSVVHLELPLFMRMLTALAAGDRNAAAEHSAYLLAARESRELQEQERQMGRALSRVLGDLHPEHCSNWTPTTFSEALAAACVIYQVEEDDAADLLVYTWLEQQVSALCRMIPLGPIAGQRVLHHVLLEAPQAVASGRALPDEQIGASAPLLALASALHETQYTRIFRS